VEHDVADADNGKAYLERYGKNTNAVAAAASPATLDIDNFGFTPATLTVTAGTIVT
jgi:plastocyanin